MNAFHAEPQAGALPNVAMLAAKIGRLSVYTQRFPPPMKSRLAWSKLSSAQLSTEMLVTWARVTALRRPVSCALGIVDTAVEFFALRWQPPREQNPWYTHPGRFWYAWELTAAGPGNAFQPSFRAAPAILSVKSV